ncbi:SCO3374 family protein [Streptomyces sp. WI04-05B]|uniref:SCO3374 family protein n=1 Tax=Streptomyces TaxID=1883 RepID=UPI0029AE30F8|nr:MULTISPECIES: SCO3374 family protein [unclassified Streptomyces]MDX2544780.1 SCO3374 family protein [Streptomyces sp. WI04-05B]MDX2588694.1 SCO3374 family protein [Streptomyces sp. WI04-05A]
MAPTVPLPRRPLDTDDTTSALTHGTSGDDTSHVRRWYENELGWTTVPGSGGAGIPLLLAVGACFDVLDVPAEAGFAALRHRGQLRAPVSPVALRAERMLLLVAPGSADELPGLLDWLEWGGLTPELKAIGAGGRIEAPRPPGLPAQPGLPTPLGPPALPGLADPGHSQGPAKPQGAAVWLRPPETGCGSAIPLPTMSALGGVGGAPDLVRLVDTLATQCHRIRLRRACAQPLAFS